MKYIHKQLSLPATICVLGLFIVIISCTSENSAITTKHGYSMEFEEDVNGDQVEVNDVILFGMKVFAKDSMLTSTFGEKYPQEFRWIPEDQRSKMRNPVVDAFELMNEGDSVRVYYPADSMKGNKFGLASGENLEYVLKILQVVKADEYAAYAKEKQQELQAERILVQARAAEVGEFVDDILQKYKANELGDDLIKLDSGLEYVLHEEGGGEKPQARNKVNVHYYGVLKEDGKMFDNSFRKGSAFNFSLGVGQVIQGWDQGVAMLNKGAKATLFIPYELAYGATGRPPTIPEKADLVFYIEVIE